MGNIESSLLNIGYLETLSHQKTPIHELDPRIKLLTTLVFIIAVVSFGKYEITGLIPFIMLSRGAHRRGQPAASLSCQEDFAGGSFCPLDRDLQSSVRPDRYGASGTGAHIRRLDLLRLHHDPLHPHRQCGLNINRQHQLQRGLPGPGNAESRPASWCSSSFCIAIFSS